MMLDGQGQIDDRYRVRSGRVGRLAAVSHHQKKLFEVPQAAMLAAAAESVRLEHDHGAMRRRPLRERRVGSGKSRPNPSKINMMARLGTRISFHPLCNESCRYPGFFCLSVMLS
jgi:hypothetical protein